MAAFQPNHSQTQLAEDELSDVFVAAPGSPIVFGDAAALQLAGTVFAGFDQLWEHIAGNNWFIFNAFNATLVLQGNTGPRAALVVDLFIDAEALDGLLRFQELVKHSHMDHWVRCRWMLLLFFIAAARHMAAFGDHFDDFSWRHERAEDWIAGITEFLAFTGVGYLLL